MKHNCPQNLTAIHQGKLLTGCAKCLDNQLSESAGAAKHKRDYQKKEYYGDTLQPVPSQARDFVKRYGRDKSKEWGFSDEQIRKLS